MTSNRAANFGERRENSLGTFQKPDFQELPSEHRSFRKKAVTLAQGLMVKSGDMNNLKHLIIETSKSKFITPQKA